jgi:hypothetical protein
MAVAGAPWETMKCLRKYAGLDVRWICQHNTYGDGRVFPYDILYNINTKDECYKLISEADVVHMHVDHPFEDESILLGKKMVIQHHSVPKRGTYHYYKKFGGVYYTVRQPWLEREYPDLPTLPNLMDIEEYKPINRQNEKPKVVFAPSNNWPMEQVGTRAKASVDSILRSFGNSIVVESYMGVPYLRNLEIKRQSDILIDDVVNDTFHKTTLEGCCFGLAVITSWKSLGWHHSNLSSLPDTLRELVENRKKLEASQHKSREWILNEWHPEKLSQAYVDVYSKLMEGKLRGTLCHVS